MSNESSHGSSRVVVANWYQFAPGESVAHHRVASALLLWGLSGSGTIGVGKSRFQLDADHFIWLPWRHSIEYRADDKNPYLVGAVHVIPRMEGETPTIREVAHSAADPLYSSTCRGDIEWVTPLRAVLCHRDQFPELMHLAQAVVHAFITRPVSEEGLGWFGNALVEAWESASLEVAHTRQLPALVMTMQQYGLAHLHDHITIHDIAHAAAISVSTGERLFRRHVGVGIARWLARKRMERAGILLSTTGLKVGTVAGRVGYTDQFHFSRAFKTHFGVPPRDFSSRTRSL